MLSVVLASGAVMLASLGGVVSVWRQFGRFIERRLAYFVSFSAGVFLVVTWRLVEEAIEHSGFGAAFFWLVVGIGLSLLIFKILPTFHHHHTESEESEPHSHLDIRRIVIGDAIHNIGDGILLATSFVAGPVVGFLTTLSVFVHELVQEISEFFVLRQAGLSSKKALFLNFLVSGTILIGAVGGTLFLRQFEALETPLLAISAGVFLLVVAYDLIPHSVRHSKNRTHYATHIVWFLAGVVLMFVVNNIFGH